jgi:hypothetical protein
MSSDVRRAPRARTRVVTIAALALAVAAVGGACGSGGTPNGQATEVKALQGVAVPDPLLDLATKNEDVSVVAGTKRPFVEAVGLYSLRRDDLLQATLQISRFTKQSKATSGKFRNSVVTQIGSTTPHRFRMGSETVYLTTGRRQSVAVWWKNRYLFVLSTRDDYETPRALLRSALEIKV